MISIILSIALFVLSYMYVPLSRLQLFIVFVFLLGTAVCINYYYRAKPEEYEFSQKDYILSSEFFLFPIETDSAGRKLYTKRLYENDREYIQFISTGFGQGMQSRKVPRSIIRYVYDSNPKVLLYVAKGIIFPDLMESIIPCRKVNVILELHIPDSVAYYQG